MCKITLFFIPLYLMILVSQGWAANFIVECLFRLISVTSCYSEDCRNNCDAGKFKLKTSCDQYCSGLSKFNRIVMDDCIKLGVPRGMTKAICRCKIAQELDDADEDKLFRKNDPFSALKDRLSCYQMYIDSFMTDQLEASNDTISNT